MILFAFLVSLLSAVCDKDKNDKRNNGYDAFCVPGVEKSGILEKGSVVRMFCKMHNSSVEMKGILLEKPDNCVMIEIRAGSLLLVEGSVFVRKNEWNGHFVRNGGTCWLINTTLGVGNGEECGMMGSVVRMEGGGLSSLFVRNSEFENVVFCGSGGSILREGAGGFECIQNCRFANITMKIIEIEEMPIEKEWMMKRSKMEDCDVERSMNVLEGGIASGTEGSGSFNCNNCTFVQNERVNRKVRNTERNSTTETIEFTNAEWNECSAPCGGALYVHDNSNATLTVENSSFVKCNATSTRGGGIYALKIAECTVKHSTFVECYCVSSVDYGGAGVENYEITTQVFFENCLFKDGWTGNDAGGLGIWSSKTTKTKDCVLNCFFQNCSVHSPTSSDGGGFAHWHGVDKVVSHNCLFQGCHSDLRGGGVSIHADGHYGNLLWFCFFHNNTAPNGNDICVCDNDTDIQVVFCYSTRTEGVRYYADGDKSEWLPNEGGRSRFVASKESQENAKDTFSCGLNESCACLTISHCLSQMIVGFVEEIKVLSGKVVEGKGVDIGEKTISVNGASVSGSSIETKFEANRLGLFCVGTGKLVVSDLSVIHNSSFENNRQCRLFEVRGSGLMNVKRMDISMDAAHSEEKSIQRSLVKVEGGELKMKDVKWVQTFSTTSLISVPQESSATLTLGNCTFSNIVRTTTGSSLMSVGEGSHSITLEECTIDGCGSEDSEFGGGMMVAVGSGGSLNVKGGIAKNCYASTTQGRGGGIGLKVRETNANFHISSAFEGNRAKWGNDIFIDSPNLESAARSGKITSLTASNPLLDEIRGFDKGDDSTPIPLGAYLIPLPDEIYVSSIDAFDHSLCGFAEFPCLSLRHCLTRQEEEKKIVVDGMIEVKNELIFDSFKHTIRGKDENSGWKVIDDSDGSGESMITVSANANISSLTFSVPSALQNHEVFFFSSSQFFSLEDCSLSLQNSQSALSYVFLSVSAGEVSVSSFSALSLSIGNHPLISLVGSGVYGTFTSMSVEDINSETQSVLFGVADGASITIEDSTLSVKAASPADLPSGSIRVISTSSAKSVKLLNNTMSGFKGDGGDGGAVECTLGRDCSLEIVGGTMCGCESNGGNGGGLWVLMNEGSSFTVGNITDTSLLRTKTSNDESNLLQLESCKATQTADGECGYGGGIYLHLAEGAQSFVLRDVSFSECDAREGKEIFINAHDLSSVINRESISFGVDLNDFTKLNGFERSTLNETFAIPLVVYLWNNFSAPAFVGGSLGHDFSMCGYEASPCSTILKAVSLHFEGKNKDVSICEPFSFDEELDLTSNEWSIASKENEMKCEVSEQKEGAQNGLIESSVSVFVTGIIFSLKKSLTDHESVFECHSEKLTLTKCGMEGGDEAISTVFVKAAGGVVEINEFATKNMKIGDSSVFVVEGNAESVPSMNMTKSNFAEITFGDGSVVECHNGNIDEMSGCTFSSITRSKESGGCTSVVNNENDDDDGRDFKVKIDDCTFEGCAVAGEEEEMGGGAFFYEASANTNLLISGCEFYCCTAPHEEEGVGYGGGIMLKMQKQEEEEGKAGFVISSPVFSTDKPNNAKFGKDLFISSPLLIKSIKNETLPFVKDRLELLTEDSMRGYDGGNRECAIPLIYFWKEIGSSVFITEEGKNVAVCGLEEYPCRSVDYGLKRTVSSGVERMMIRGVCDARSVIEMSGMKAEGTNGETDKIQFVKAIEGDGDAIVECKGAVQFKEMGMVIPTAFDNGASILIQTGSDAIKTSIVSCSISTHGSAEGEVSFVLIGASKGIVEIEKTNIAGLSSMCEIMSVSTDCAIAMNNVTFEDIALSGKSAVAMSENTIASSEKNDAEEVWNILFEQCIFANVKHSATINPSLLCCDVSNDVRLKMENSTIDGCGSASSNEGGGMFFLLNERGKLEMNHTNVVKCFCSNIGRGGGMFLKSQSVSQEALPFVLSNITLRENVASKGRDVFVKCTDLDSQISESQFLINFGEPFVKELAIWGCTADNYGDEEDLLRRVFVFRSEFIFVSSVVGNSSDSKQCGEMKSTCSSLDVGVSHIIPSDYSQLLIWNETTLTGSCSAQRVTIKSMEASRNAKIKVSEISLADEGVVRTSESVRFEKVIFAFDGVQNAICSCLLHQMSGSLILESVSFHSESRTTANPQLLFDASLIVVEDGVFEADACSVNSLGFTKPVFNILGSERASFDDLGVDDVRCKSSVIECGKSEKVSVSRLTGTNITLQNESLISFENGHSSLFVSLVLSSFSNISRSTSGSCIVCTTHPMGCFEMCNCSLSKCSSESQKGSQVAITSAEKILMESCVFEGSLEERTENYLNREEEICRWNGSVVDVAKSSVMMKDTAILNSPEGGITTSGGNVKIEKGEFLNNNPSIEGYPSLRRNIICSDSGILNVMSLKGGDGLERNTSLWMLDDGCSFEGIVSERDSSFVIPVLESVEAKKEANRMKLAFKGMLLVPCNLSFSVVKRKGDEKEIEKFDFDMEGFLSEKEVEGSVAKDLLSSCGNEIEVSASILFGNAESPSSTNPFILKNASEAKGGDERIVEGGNKEMSIWPIIVIVLVVILLIVLVGFILFVVRWKKQKRRTEELEVIVEDNIRKDPKAIEMVTMEMSPEDQWRRAEREAEKKNEERIKKMVFEKSLGHSESSEHLLSESGSTEYILGRDSDKIPEWMLEKVDEKEEDDEETRKRTPSPSISSISTTDSDSTFVRGEDLCPTTSSMSNLVDAMACSSPHEKLIVDLRDSLFMLLHGRNKTKEMAIGTLKEREQTAAQILFWVANLALHSFDEMENELSSLANLSPHLVLFSEHMVICIVMHSDLLSDDDSDSSSISSSTVATSVSDDDRDSLPSSAFEDEDDFRKECLRWKAPELLINKKMGATKESVAFSIGMMLWECLTLQIPFGEYEAEIAGEKIKNGERPPMQPIGSSAFSELVNACLSVNPADRQTLTSLKRLLIQHFPPGAAILTLSDAVDYTCCSDRQHQLSGSALCSSISATFIS